MFVFAFPDFLALIVSFPAWGSHWDKTEAPYLTAAAAIGMTKDDIETFIRRLDKVLASSRSKGGGGGKPTAEVGQASTTTTPKTPTKVVPTIEVEKNGSASGSPGPKKLTYV